MESKDTAMYEDFGDDQITRAIIGAAIDVHRALGPGLLESAYHVCLTHLLRKRGLRCDVEVPLAVVFDGVHLDCGYRMDLVVENAVIVEIKSVEKTLPIHEAQLLTYLRLSGHKRSLMINFNVPVLKHGITRKVMSRIGPDPSLSASSASQR